MEKKSGIVVTHEGLFIPARYFRQMADRLEVVLSSEGISIRSSIKGRLSVQKRRTRRKVPLSKGGRG